MRVDVRATDTDSLGPGQASRSKIVQAHIWWEEEEEEERYLEEHQLIHHGSMAKPNKELKMVFVCTIYHI